MRHVFIGYDSRSPIAYHTLAQSILETISEPVALVPLVKKTLNFDYGFPKMGLTEFTFSRWLVPELMGHQGTAIFMDSDVVVLGDLVEVFRQVEADPSKAIWCVKKESPHLRFEWSAMMAFNCAHPSLKDLDAASVAQSLETQGRIQAESRKPSKEQNDAVMKMEPRFPGLNSLKWLKDEEIGALHDDWHMIVGYEAPNPDAKLIHYTQGIPLFPETQTCMYSDVYKIAAKRAGHSVPWSVLMGNSVHAPKVYERLYTQGHEKLIPPHILAALKSTKIDAGSKAMLNSKANGTGVGVPGFGFKR